MTNFGRGAILTTLLICLNINQSYARDLNKAPPSFAHRGQKAVPIDISRVEIDYEFNVQKRQASARALMTFHSEEDGFPIFDLVPTVQSLKLDGQIIPAQSLETRADPHNVTKLRILNQKIQAHTPHTLEIHFTLPSTLVTYGQNFVRVGFFMSDLAIGGRRFFEQYGPANWEFDQIAYTFNVRVTGTNKEHHIFANGEIHQNTANNWSIAFPEYFTTSSLYFHLSEKGRFKHKSFTYTGINSFPVDIYSESIDLIRRAHPSAEKILSELEQDYGAYHHQKLIIYVTQKDGGMEHSGATITSLWALGHELTHSWFARGVMPTSGNAGWIDEAIASWRDKNYYSATAQTQRPAVNLGNFSVYKRETTDLSYTQGAQFLSELQFLFRNSGGMKPLLKSFYEEFVGQTINTEDFRSHLENITGVDLKKSFARYVYGQQKSSEWPEVSIDFSNRVEAESSKETLHPRPFTSAELVELR